MPGWLLVASCRRSPDRSSASLSPGPRIQLRGREREVASPKPGPRTSQLRGPRARPPAGPAAPAPQAGLAQVRGNAQVRGPAQVRGADAPEPVTASGLPARARWSSVGRPRPTTPAKPHSDGGCPREAGGVRGPSTRRGQAGALHTHLRPRKGHLSMQGEVWPGGFHGEAVFTVAAAAWLGAGASLGPAGVAGALGRGALNFTHTTGNS